MSSPYTISSSGSGYVTTAIADPTDTTLSLNAAVIEATGRMELKGNRADLVINGVSLNETLKGIQDRLNMLRPNAALEAEWDQLQELGQQYRKLEAELKEKQRAWEILRKQG